MQTSSSLEERQIKLKVTGDSEKTTHSPEKKPGTPELCSLPGARPATLLREPQALEEQGASPPPAEKAPQDTKESIQTFLLPPSSPPPSSSF